MRALAEPISRRSNFEEKCNGRFWERRYKCQKLADEMAVLACSANVSRVENNSIHVDYGTSFAFLIATEFISNADFSKLSNRVQE